MIELEERSNKPNHDQGISHRDASISRHLSSVPELLIDILDFRGFQGDPCTGSLDLGNETDVGAEGQTAGARARSSDHGRGNIQATADVCGLRSNPELLVRLEHVVRNRQLVAKDILEDVGNEVARLIVRCPYRLILKVGFVTAPDSPCCVTVGLSGGR